MNFLVKSETDHVGFVYKLGDLTQNDQICFWFDSDTVTIFQEYKIVPDLKLNTHF